MANVTTTESRLPLIVRLVNQFGEILNRLHLHPVNLSREHLMAAARKQTGLSDWGEDDFLTSLTVLLDAYEAVLRFGLPRSNDRSEGASKENLRLFRLSLRRGNVGEYGSLAA